MSATYWQRRVKGRQAIAIPGVLGRQSSSLVY
jgi:hypothetical protein